MFAIAMAQIASAFPTAGGLYHWGSILGNRFTGWLTAWLNLLGLVTVLGAINVGTYYFFVGTFGPTAASTDSISTWSSSWPIITGLQALFNHLGIGLTAMLTDFSGYMIFATALVLARGLPGVCAGLSNLGRLWTFTNYSGEAGGNVWPPVSDGMGVPAGPAAADLHHHRL